MILNELRNILLREDEEFNYYNVGFDIAPENLGVPDHEMNNFEKDMGGDISGDVGDFEDVESKLYDDLVSVTGIVKLPSSTTYETYEESVPELALRIYNQSLETFYDTRLSDVDVSYRKETEDFNKNEF